MSRKKMIVLVTACILLAAGTAGAVWLKSNQQRNTSFQATLGQTVTMRSGDSAHIDTGESHIILTISSRYIERRPGCDNPQPDGGGVCLHPGGLDVFDVILEYNNHTYRYSTEGTEYIDGYDYPAVGGSLADTSIPYTAIIVHEEEDEISLQVVKKRPDIRDAE